MDSKPASEPISPQPLDSWFLELLACPGCEQRRAVQLNAAKDALDCACGRYAFPVRDGIPVLLVDEAAVLDPNITPGGKAEG